MEAFANIISFISGFLYSYILIALLIAAGLYFTIKTGFIQFRLFGESIRVIAEKREDRESISSFQALMVSTASRVGTGNVVGVTGAIIAGGAGAVFWMWLIAIIGSASAFIESTLAQIYKKKGEHGSYGGPAYYIKQGLGSPLLGGAFAVALIHGMLRPPRCAPDATESGCKYGCRAGSRTEPCSSSAPRTNP